ncbi:hypothetical protein MSG28_015907 [Choristoneura fumiferana]|uniref:Uncharacterized protein n=1 Tax=Choristoneura fumiferana TaxID=7141 RepID=A0ACC0K4M5_CHOFU|nr:hypothetical protein MSG28_015907 [Choristoneura fumiferana]
MSVCSIWDIKLCILCGSSGMHSRCLAAERMLCGACRPAAADITRLEARLAEGVKRKLNCKLSETEESLEQSKEIRKIDDENVKTDDFLTDEINLVNKDSIDAKDSNCSEGEGAIEKSDSNPTVDDNDTTKSDDGDDDSSATFELPSESVAKSDDSLNDFDTPKTLKTVDIEHNSSLEISEHDDVVTLI